MKTNQTPRKLGHFIKVNGFTYKQVIRSSYYAIYAQLDEIDGKPTSYEVIKIQIKGGNIYKGRPIPLYEAYPKTSLWGCLGWTYHKEEAAFAKYNALLEKEAKSSPIFHKRLGI